MRSRILISALVALLALPAAWAQQARKPPKRVLVKGTVREFRERHSSVCSSLSIPPSRKDWAWACQSADRS